MDYTRENLPGSQVKLNYTVAGEEWKAAIKKAYEKTKSQYSVEGFRKGKVPQKVLENMYGVGVFFEDALDIILPDCYSYALEREKDLVPVARPDVQLQSISDTEAKVAIVVTVKPEIELGAYTGHTVKKNVKAVADADVDARIKEAQDRAGSWEEVTGRAVISGDTVYLDYSGTVDGIKFDGGTAQNQPLVIGSGSFIPGFEDQLIGANINEEKDIKVAFPKEYGAEQLAGKDAIFHVKINSIKVKALPALDDEFAKDISEFDTLEAYKADVKAKIAAENEESADSEATNTLIDMVIDGSKMEIPAAMIESQIDDMIEEFEQRIQYQGMKMDDYLKYAGLKMEDVRARYKDMALKNIKIRLVLDSIVKKEGIKVEKEEFEAKLESLAKEYGKDKADFMKDLTPEQSDYINNAAVSDKLLAYLKANNKFEA